MEQKRGRRRAAKRLSCVSAKICARGAPHCRSGIRRTREARAIEEFLKRCGRLRTIFFGQLVSVAVMDCGADRGAPGVVPDQQSGAVEELTRHVLQVSFDRGGVERRIAEVIARDQEVQCEPVARDLADRGVEAEDLGVRRPTLDEVFLALTESAPTEGSAA